MAKRLPYAPPVPAKIVTPARTSHLPYPHRNLGAHLKAPKDGEIVTSHHRGARKT